MIFQSSLPDITDMLNQKSAGGCHKTSHTNGKAHLVGLVGWGSQPPFQGHLDARVETGEGSFEIEIEGNFYVLSRLGPGAAARHLHLLPVCHRQLLQPQ